MVLPGHHRYFEEMLRHLEPCYTGNGSSMPTIEICFLADLLVFILCRQRCDFCLQNIGNSRFVFGVREKPMLYSFTTLYAEERSSSLACWWKSEVDFWRAATKERGVVERPLPATEVRLREEGVVKLMIFSETG